LQARKRRKQAFFSQQETEQYQNEERGCRNKKVKKEKQKDIMEKQKEKDETQKEIIEKTKHKQAREIVFLSLPHSTRKIQANFLSKLLHFS